MNWAFAASPSAGSHLVELVEIEPGDERSG